MTSSTPRSSGGPLPPLPLFEIVHTARLADRIFTAAFAEQGLAPGQFGVLASVNDEPGITQSGVARRLNVRPQTVARPVQALLGQGLLHAEDPAGRGGATALAITPAGRRVLDTAWPAVLAVNDPSTLGLRPSEASELIALLGKVRQHLQSP